MTNYHVTKDNIGWGLKKEDGTRSIKRTETKKEIMDYIKGGTFTKKPVSVKIHKEDGKFQEERTYPRKADPKKSKG